MMMEMDRNIPSIPYDGSIQTTHEGARHLTNPASIGSCQQPYPAGDAVPVSPDRMASMAESMASCSIDSAHASFPLDHATQSDDDTHTLPPSFAQANLDDLIYSRRRVEYNGSTQIDPVDYLSNELLANPAAHTGATRDHCPTPILPTVSDYSFPDDMLSLLSTSSNLPHGSLSSQRQHGAGAPLVAPTPIMANVVFSAPLPYPNPDRVVQELQHLHLGSQGQISPHFEPGNHQQFVLNLPSGYSRPRFSSPELIHEGGMDDPLLVPLLTDGHTDYPPPYYPTLDNRTRSYGVHRPVRTQSDRTSGHRRVLTLPPYCLPRVNEIRRPHPRTRVHTTGHIPDNVVDGQACPTSMHTAGQDVTDSPLPFPEIQYHYPKQQTTIWDGVERPFSVVNLTRMSMEHSSGHFYRAFSSSVYQNEVALSTYSISSFPGWRVNDMKSCPSSPKGQPPNLPLFSGTPPSQHEFPRQETFECTPGCSNSDEAFPDSPDTVKGGLSAALPPILADGEQNGFSPFPATCPSNSRAQQRLQNILSLPSPLRNEALITLLRLILESPFIWTHEMESTIDSDYGQALLAQVNAIPDCPPNVLQLLRGSIYTAFVSYHEFVCLICGKPNQSMIRGIGCVRSHLDHRPFSCRGQCGRKSCPRGQIGKRFFTASLLRDHRSIKGTTCTSCGATLKSSMKRHWDSKHHDVPFPYDHYPYYRKEQPSHS